MRLDPKEKIADIPILKVRDFLRKNRYYHWNTEVIVNEFKVSDATAKLLVNQLFSRKFIVEKEKKDGISLWELTQDGIQFSVASGAKPIKRKTAERKIKEFLSRVDVVNEDTEYLYKVTKVVVFGSYLDDTDRLGDIDLAIQISSKEADNEKFRELREEKTRKALKNGRHFSNVVEQLAWSQTETMMFLKSRSRSLSIQHLTEDLLELAGNHKTIYEEESK
jgi:predicted nucleotidyltransferase